MRKSKNILTLVLMTSSVVLLVVLQVFWLRSSYEKAFFDFRRETTTLLRTTVFGLRDSLFVKNIEPVTIDSAKFSDSPARLDSFRFKFQTADSPAHHYKVREVSKVQVYVASTTRTDSAADWLRPLASTFHKLDGQKSFIIRMGPDTLSRDTLSIHFSEALRKSDIHIAFLITHAQTTDPLFRAPRTFGIPGEPSEPENIEHPGAYRDTLFTEQVRLNPMHAYAAIFPGIRANVLKEIAPQILFSCFLTFIIAASFVIMYRSLRSQQRLNELKNDFISNVTHELKTPVATVSVALEAMKDFNALNNPERTKEYLSIAQNELNRLTLMTDKILKASVFENHGVSLIPEKINLDSIVQEVLSSMKLVFEKKKLKVNYTLEGTDFELEGSEVHLTNVVYNLVDNALKYSSENSSIELHLKTSEKHVEFSIQDHGIGIAKEYQKKIFEKFFRVPTGDVHNVKGYGLGLNYVAGVVKSHAGKIEVESEEGKGSLFKIILSK